MTAPTPPKNDWVDKNTAGHPPTDWTVSAAAQNNLAANIIYLLSQSAGKQPSNALLTAISSLVDPNTDKLIFWDDSASTLTYLSLGTNLSITGTTLNATGGGAGGATNLTTTQTTTDVTVVSDTGSDAVIPAATGTLAGTMTAADRVKFATIATNADVTNTTTVTAAGAVMTSTKNVPNGVLGLNASGQANAAQLPSYVDDVVAGANLAAFPTTGETDKIYLAIDTGFSYRWTGTTYFKLPSAPGSTDEVPEGALNLYYTNARADARIAAGITGKQALNANLTSISTLVDPNADRIAFWDDSAGAWAFLTLGTNLSITGTTLNATGGAAGGDASTNTSTSVDSEVVLFSGTAGKTLKRATGTGVPQLASGVLSVSATLPVSAGGTGAATAPAARTNLGSTTVGDAVFIAASAAAARTAIGAVRELQVSTVVSSTTPTPDVATWDETHWTAAANATFGVPTGSPTDGQPHTVRLKATASITVGYNAIYRARTGLTLTTSLTSGQNLYLAMKYNLPDTKWDIMDSGTA